jgi:cardiolipin synthase
VLLGPFLLACAAALDGRPGYGVVAVALFGAAALTDALDGRIARRGGVASGRGQLLDTVADVLFVEGTFVGFVLWDVLPWILPLAVAVSVGAYGVATRRRSRLAGRIEFARSRLGHAAGVLNYALVGVLAALSMVPEWLPGRPVTAAALLVAAVNLLAALEHVVALLRADRRASGARVSPGRDAPAASS